MVMKNYQILIILLLLIAFFLSLCNISYFIPPKESILEFKFGDYQGKFKSGGFEAVSDDRYIEFYTPKKPENLIFNKVTIVFKHPVTPKTYIKEDCIMEFDDCELDYPKSIVLTSKDPRTKLLIDLKEWSNKPRGLIEGYIEATFYDYEDKKYEMKGYFKAYQALGTINSFH